MLSDDKTLRNR